MDSFCRDEARLSHHEKEEFLEMFNPLIKKCLNNISFQEREDFEQEIKARLLDKLNHIYTQDAPGFWEFAMNYETTKKE
ncbi:hypothetical protein VSK91_22680 [Bacillus swezeyi]|uniref:hypothetical protein n=1 Tax=Bacillus swezeyi TaxID=1925020 RepID=UPI0039C640D8